MDPYFYSRNLNSVLIQSQYANNPMGVAVRTGALVSDIRVVVSEDPQSESRMLPVGSVEFVRASLETQGVIPPKHIDYPDCLHPYLHRRVKKTEMRYASPDSWVKPVNGKVFEPGLVKDVMDTPWSYQYVPVWESEAVEWLCEYRYYICEGMVTMVERYDPDGADDAPKPDEAVVGRMVADYAVSRQAPAGFSMDIGVLSTGQTALVEVNDGYALGLYGTITTAKSKIYLDLLEKRYLQIARLSRRLAMGIK